MRKRVRREWVWVPVLIAVLALALFGCTPTPKTEERRVKEFISGRETYYEKQFVEIEYKSHTYIYYSRNNRMGLTHAAHCKGRHL